MGVGEKRAHKEKVGWREEEEENMDSQSAKLYFILLRYVFNPLSGKFRP